jgi:hypothetical protein
VRGLIGIRIAASRNISARETQMEPASTLPDEVQLYLTLVGLLREDGLACASMQVDCRTQAEDPACESALVVTATPPARSLLAPRIERQLGRPFDPEEDGWLVSRNEAWQLIDDCAVQ